MRSLLFVLLMSLLSCGGDPVVPVKFLAPPLLIGPKASPEEVSGELPALRPIRGSRALVPEKLVPPAPPPDPIPDFKRQP